MIALFFFFLISTCLGIKLPPPICKKGIRTSVIIVCSPKCGGCQLEDGRKVSCPFLPEDKFLILLGYYAFQEKRSEHRIVIAKRTRVKCISGKNTKGIACKRKAPIITDEGNKMICTFESSTGTNLRQVRRDHNEPILNKSTDLIPTNEQMINTKVQNKTYVPNDFPSTVGKRNESNIIKLRETEYMKSNFTWRREKRIMNMSHISTRSYFENCYPGVY